MKLYMILSKDKYELPMIVAESIQEIAIKTGKSVRNLYSCFCKGKHLERNKYYRRYITMEVEDDD